MIGLICIDKINMISCNPTIFKKKKGEFYYEKF